jgi:hypothetical protein
MVTGRPNRAVVELAAVGGWENGPAPGWVRCVVEVAQVWPIPGEHDLLSPSIGRQLTAMLRHELARNLPLDRHWRVEARLVGPHMLRVLALLGVGLAE